MISSILNWLTNTLLPAIIYESRKQVTVPWVANDGTVELTIPTGWAAGSQVDIVGFFAVLTATGGGATTWVCHASATTGWTIGDVSEHYQSEDAPPTPVASPIVDSIPGNPAMFELPASGNLFLRVVPDVGTTSGSANVFIGRRR